MSYPYNATVYNRYGATARYVSDTPEGHLVIPVIEVYVGDDVEEQDGEPAIWREVFSKPPTEKLNAEIADLNARLSTLRNEINAARGEHRDMDAEIAARRARIAQHEQLAQLDTFLTKGVTHYVTVSYGWVAILSKEDTKCDYYRDSFKLLTLYGSSEGNLTWKLNKYRDGSGGSETECYPTASLDGAKEIAARLFENKWAEWRSDRARYCHLESYVESAKRLGYVVPEDVLEHVKAGAVKSKLTQVDEAEKALSAAKAALEKAQAS